MFENKRESIDISPDEKRIIELRYDEGTKQYVLTVRRVKSGVSAGVVTSTSEYAAPNDFYQEESDALAAFDKAVESHRAK